jgi:hypothetical protein
VWMRYSINELQRLRSLSIGTEVGGLRSKVISQDIRKIIKKLRLVPEMSARHERIVAAYIEDMRAAIREVARVLCPGGKAVYVIGENTIRGTYVRNSKILIAVAADAGLRVQRQRVRLLPNNRRYLPPPSGSGYALDSRIRREVVLTFSKPSRRVGRR